MNTMLGINNKKFASYFAMLIIASLEMISNAIKIQVQDFGVGIPEKDQDKIFKPFGLYCQANRAGIKGIGMEEN